MGLWIAVIAVAVLAVAAVAVVVLRRRGSTSIRESTVPTPSRPTAAPAAPMTDLESALAQVTDRDGRPIREKIDAESVHVDPLRDPDDTGPLLRRALDSIAPHEEVDEAPGGDTPDQDPA
ncbi:MAG TPA: hypothetical protein VK917_03230 [Ilumatobacter sp.]|nr:hypothetical protein [Ilumatobacter sp.]